MVELAQFFHEYAERCMASDADAIAALCEAQFLAVRNGTAIHLADRGAVRDHFAEHIAAYARAGAARIEVVGLDVRELGASSATAIVRWHALDSDGGLPRDLSTTYHPLRPGDSWRILSYTNHE